MMFRDSQEGVFPKAPISEALVQEGRMKDQSIKLSRQEKINEGKFRVHTNLTIGDTVLMRNHRRTSKFDPTFIPEPFEVIDIGQGGRNITLSRRSDGAVFRRHPDDVKLSNGEFIDETNESNTRERFEIDEWHKRVNDANPQDDGDERGYFRSSEEEPRRSTRVAQKNPRYFNEDYEA